MGSMTSVGDLHVLFSFLISTDSTAFKWKQRDILYLFYRNFNIASLLLAGVSLVAFKPSDSEA